MLNDLLKIKINRQKSHPFLRVNFVIVVNKVETLQSFLWRFNIVCFCRGQHHFDCVQRAVRCTGNSGHYHLFFF
ncbi:hypothetical protein AWP68_15890 [Escherichia coli]|nr:hypothetical protein AWP68_15890 [Escherichia coli]